MKKQIKRWHGQPIQSKYISTKNKKQNQSKSEWINDIFGNSTYSQNKLIFLNSEEAIIWSHTDLN